MLETSALWDDVGARILGAVGSWERSRRRPKTALRAFEGELAIWDALVLQYWPDRNDVVLLKRNQLETLGEFIALQRRIGQTAEALGSSRRAEAIAVALLHENPADVNRLISWGTALVTEASLEREVGRTVSAATRAALGEVGQRLEERSADLTDATALYNLARWDSVLSGLGPLAEGLPADQGHGEQRARADRAMAALHRAVAAGWKDVVPLKLDPDFDPLRARADFQVLLLDLAFPADSFAP
jgi:hypothetical protein